MSIIFVKPGVLRLWGTPQKIFIISQRYQSNQFRTADRFYFLRQESDCVLCTMAQGAPVNTRNMTRPRAFRAEYKLKFKMTWSKIIMER